MQTLIDYDLLPEVVRNFVMYKQTVQGRSKRTADEYALDIRTFSRWLMLKRSGAEIHGSEMPSEIDISDLDLDFYGSVKTEEIYEFMYYTLKERGNEWSARSRKLSALRSFYKYLTINKHLLDFDPTKNIEGPNSKKPLPKFMSLEESESLLRAVLDDTASKTRERDYCILTLFLNCGMRLSELCGINLSDIDSRMESLKVTGKGSKQRIIYLNDACRSAITDYLRVRAADQEIRDRDALFLSSRHTRISNKTVQWMVYKYLEKAGLGNRDLSTHKLRHTAATLMYRTGTVDIRVLKDILGHEQLNTTQIYTHVSSEGMKHAVDANPLAHTVIKHSSAPADTESNDTDEPAEMSKQDD